MNICLIMQKLLDVYNMFYTHVFLCLKSDRHCYTSSQQGAAATIAREKRKKKGRR